MLDPRKWTTARTLSALALGASALLLSAAPARAQDAAPDDRPLPGGGKPVLAAPDGTPASPVPLDGVSETTGDQSTLGRVTTVDADGEGAPKGKAIRVTTTGTPTEPWGVGVAFPTAAAVKKGDTLFARFYLRAVKSTTNEGFTGFTFEKAGPDWAKSVEFQASAVTGGADGQAGPWKRFDVPFTASRDFAAGEAHASFRFGYPTQTVDVAGIELLDFGTSVDKAALPRTRATYRGMEPDAPWRAAAAERIEKIRKGDLTVRVTDAAGEPVEGATVRAKMTRHAFPFGTAATAALVTADTPTGERYRAELLKMFNAVVFENDLKWPAMEEWDGTGWGRERPKLAARWMRENGLLVRGHTLVWPGRDNLPASIVAMENDPAEMKKAVEDHVLATAKEFRGLVDHWDVINEPFNNHFLQDVLGEGVLADYFRLAKRGDPEATLFINDWGIVAAGNATDTPHQQAYYDTIKSLLDAGAPLEGIGVQGHFGGTLTDPENLLKIVGRFAEFGLPIYVTELDINTDDEALRTQYLRDFHVAMFSDPAIEGILHWGFWSGAHWLPAAALLDEDFNPRPHGQAYLDLVHGEWQTDETATTAADGTATIRGFLGDYDVTVTGADGATTSATALLARGGTEAEVKVGK